MDLSTFLHKLKLTSYEHEIILYLSSVEVANAKQIYEHTGVPKGRIYQVLADLQQKGFVTVVPTTPKSYEIKDVKQALKQYLEGKKEELEEQEHEIAKLNIAKQSLEERNEPSVNIMTGREEHINAIALMRKGAKQELLQIAPSFIGSTRSRTSLGKALQRGVSVKIITLAVTVKNKEQIDFCVQQGGEVRTLEFIEPMAMLLRDRNDFLLGVQDRENREERMTIYSKNKGLRKVLEDAFWRMWKQAAPVKQALNRQKRT